MDEGKRQEQGRTDVKRRRLTAGLFLGIVGSLAGCGGSDESVLQTSIRSAVPVPTPGRPTTPGTSPGTTGSTPGTAPATPTWEVVATRSLALTPGTSFNLASTLPATVAQGGVFEVDASGSPLPQGINLSPNGLLFVSASAAGGTAGVIFRYTPPA